MRRMSLAILATVVGVLGATSVASAAGPVQDGQFNLKFTEGKIVITGLGAIDIPSGNVVDVLANVDPSGKVAIPIDALKFPPIPLTDPLPLSVSIGQTSRSDGSIDPATGAVSFPLNLSVNIDGGPGLSCKIPLAFTFDTASHAVDGSNSVTGAAYDQGTGTIALAGTTDIPNPIPAADCAIADLVSGLLGGVSGKIGLELKGSLDMPGGAKYADPLPDPCASATPPASCTPPPPPPPPVVLKNPVASLGSSTLKSTKGSVAVPIKCAGTVALNKPCAGKATLTTKVTTIKTKKVKGKKKKVKTTKTVTLGSASYSAVAGATATPKIKLSSANQKLLKAAKNKLKGLITITTTGGTGVKAKSITIKG